VTGVWEKGIDNDVVRRELAQALGEDMQFEDGRILGSMCTEPLDIAKESHLKFITANLGNPGLYPGTQRLESDIIDGLGTMLNCPEAGGSVVSGGTEANITALWLARNASRRRRVLFPQSAHFSFHKACDLLALEPVAIPLSDEYTIDLDAVDRALSNDVCAIVGIAGTTELGVVDDIAGLANLLPEGAFLHVDAAFGGFVLPFLRRLGRRVPDFDFGIPEVASLTIDPHKMGMATVPAGALLLRDDNVLMGIRKDAPYLTNIGRKAALSGTRCSAAVAATYAAMRSLGMEGYEKIVRDCMDVTGHAVKRGRALGLEPVIEPVMNIACFHVPGVEKVLEEMNSRGWSLSMSQHPESLRLVLMPHVTRESVDEMFEVLGDVLRRL
jgi:tyrosine decarboxylase/aspartate 1-decarboxylase